MLLTEWKRVLLRESLRHEFGNCNRVLSNDEWDRVINKVLLTVTPISIGEAVTLRDQLNEQILRLGTVDV